jgi:hypothetical protein
VVLYECEIWSLTIRAEHRLRVLENRVLMIIFGPRRDEVTVVWRKQHNDEVHNLSTLNSMVWVRERTIQTERPPVVGEVIANLCG